MTKTTLHLGQLPGRARRHVDACTRPATAVVAQGSWRPAAPASHALRITGVVGLATAGYATVPAGNSGFMANDPAGTKRPARHLRTRST